MKRLLYFSTSLATIMFGSMISSPMKSGATESGSVLDTIAVGQTPVAIASDGTHVWVVNNGSNSVSEVQISNDAVVRTISVGRNPWGISSDGNYVWVTNWDSQDVSEIQISTGTVINTIPVGSGPWGISSDGTDVWVANELSGSVSEIQISTGTVLRTIAVAGEPQGISSDGTNVWVASYLGGVTEIQASTGQVLRTISVGSHPWSISSDGTDVWVANSGSNFVSEIEASTGTLVRNIQLGYQPQDISTDGTTVWVADYSDGAATEIVAATGEVVKTVSLPNSPYAISTDGTDVWVANAGVVNSISKIAVKGSPGAPLSLVRSVPSDGQVASFSWAQPYDGGSPISGYSVQTSLDGVNWSTTLEQAGITSFSLNLGANPNIFFQVAAINSYGVGAYATASISRTAPLQPVATGTISGDGGTASFSWSPPADGGSAIVGYEVQTCTDGVNWSTSNVSPTTFSAQATLQAGMGVEVRVAAVNSVGVSAFSIPTFVSSPGLMPRLVRVLTSDGQPVTGGAITWSGPGISSSVDYGLTSTGEITFPSAPSGAVSVTLTDGVMPDGSYVSGTYTMELGLLLNTMTLQPEPTSAITTIKVSTPGGVGVSGAMVSVPNVASSAQAGSATFTVPQVISSGTTDSYGNFEVIGYIAANSQATAVYNDGVVTQTANSVVNEPITSIQLRYAPVVLPRATSIIASANALVSVVLNASRGSFMTSRGLRSNVANTSASGITVRAVLPLGYKSCQGQKLLGATNNLGSVTLKFCATKTGTVSFKAAGAYVAGVYNVYVRGSVPTAVLGAIAATPTLAHASLSWSAPVFNGGSPITKYVVTLSAAGKRTVVVNTTSTHVNVGGLADATRYNVSIVAINKTGTSSATSLKVSVA